jgi:hypothetical protein
MSMKLAGYEFEGPIVKTRDLKKLPGVFAVITLDEIPLLVDIDSGVSIRESVKKHPRKRTWRHLSKPVGHAFVVRYQDVEDKITREELVNDIREKMDVPCGN